VSRPPSAPASPQVSDHVATLWANRWIVLTVVAVFVLGAFGFSRTQKASFSATQDVLVGSGALTSTDVPDLETEADLASSGAVAELALRTLEPEVARVQDVQKALTVKRASEGRVLAFTYQAPTAPLAVAGARASAAAYLQYRELQIVEALDADRDNLQRVREFQLDRLARLNQIIGSATPGSPEATDARFERVSVQARLDQLGRDLAENGAADRSAGQMVGPTSQARRASTPLVAVLLAGGIMGLLLGSLLAYGLEGLRGRVRSSREIESVFGSPVLGVVPLVRDAPREDLRKALAIETDTESPVAEAFRVLRSSVLRLAGEDARVLLVTSGAAGEGKSTTAANLAVRIAGSGKQVVLVDADLRRPSIHRYFGVGNRNGLRHLLQDETRGLPISITGFPGLAVISSGPATAASADHFEADSFRRVLDRLRPLADYIVIDAPPVFVSDTVLMAPVVDGIVFVADAGRLTNRSLARSRDLLDRLGLRATGIVLNKYQGGPGSEFGYRPYRYDKKADRSTAAVDNEADRPKRGSRRTRSRGDETPGLREATS
jgi:capsular exopolysaccharide synthesis family protein